MAYSRAHFGQGTGRIFLRDVSCTGTESRLLSCDYSTPSNSFYSCRHYEDAGVRCPGSYSTISKQSQKQDHCLLITCFAVVLTRSMSARSSSSGEQHISSNIKSGKRGTVHQWQMEGYLC